MMPALGVMVCRLKHFNASGPYTPEAIGCHRRRRSLPSRSAEGSNRPCIVPVIQIELRRIKGHEAVTQGLVASTRGEHFGNEKREPVTDVAIRIDIDEPLESVAHPFYV